MDGSNGLTCVTCRVVFENPDLQRDHYRTEWHRYNLKRQAVDLPAIEFKIFSEKVQNFNEGKEPLVKEATDPFYCKPCKKQIKTENAMNDHLASKKHKENVKKLETGERKGPKQPRKKPENIEKEKQQRELNKKNKEDSEEEDDDDDDDSSGWETDNGEEEEEQEQEADYNEDEALPTTNCLFCPQIKSTLEEMKKHMQFHHDFVLPDQKYLIDEIGCLEYLGLKVGAGRYCIYCPDRKARFTTIESCQKHMRDKEHCKLRRDVKSMIELNDFYDYSSKFENEEQSSSNEFLDDGWTLTLPSGAQIGHRHLFKYFKQYLRPVNGTQRLLSRAAIEKARGIYPALTWTGTSNVVEAKKVARDMKFIERFRRRVDLRVAVKSNKLFKSQGFVGDN